MSILGCDQKRRCFGGEVGKEFYGLYHDLEWGQPHYDEQALFEILCLEGAQAGLSFETILKKREGYRSSFHNFDPKKVSDMSDKELEGLCTNPEIVRHRGKIFSVRQNARAFLNIQDQKGGFSQFVWSYVEGTPLINRPSEMSELPSFTPLSLQLSKDLRAYGMNFVGPTIMYAFMQAAGLVNDHLVDCWCSPPSDSEK